MAFKSAAFSLFIIIMAFTSEAMNALHEDSIGDEVGRANWSIGRTPTYRGLGLEESGLTEDTADVLDNYNMTDRPQSALATEGIDWGMWNALDMAYNVLFKSSVGVYDWSLQIVGIPRSATEGYEGAKTLLKVIAAIINLNHLIAISQLLGYSFGGKA